MVGGLFRSQVEDHLAASGDGGPLGGDLVGDNAALAHRPPLKSLLLEQVLGVVEGELGDLGHHHIGQFIGLVLLLHPQVIQNVGDELAGMGAAMLPPLM